MSCHARAALAAVVVAASMLAPAAAGERATLKVTAHVVDRCTVEVPYQVPPGLWRDHQQQPGRLVRHECQGGPPLRVDAMMVLVEQLRARLPGDGRPELRPGLRSDGGRVVETQHPTRADVVVITITY